MGGALITPFHRSTAPKLSNTKKNNNLKVSGQLKMDLTEKSGGNEHFSKLEGRVSFDPIFSLWTYVVIRKTVGKV